MKVADMMRKEVAIVEERSTVAETAKVLLTCNEDLAVICTKGKPLGVITSYDIASHLGKGGSPSLRAAKIMSSPVISISPYADVEEALHHMEAQRLRKYPVIIGSRIVGTVSLQDLAEWQNAHIRFHRHLQNLVLILFVIFEVAVFVLRVPGGRA